MVDFHSSPCATSALVPSSLPDDGQDHRHFFPGDGTEFIAGLVNLRPILLPDLPDRGPLLAGQVQLPEVRDPRRQAIACAFPALSLQLGKLRLLLGSEDI